MLLPLQIQLCYSKGGDTVVRVIIIVALAESHLVACQILARLSKTLYEEPFSAQSLLQFPQAKTRHFIELWPSEISCCMRSLHYVPRCVAYIFEISGAISSRNCKLPLVNIGTSSRQLSSRCAIRHSVARPNHKQVCPDFSGSSYIGRDKGVY